MPVATIVSNAIGAAIGLLIVLYGLYGKSTGTGSDLDCQLTDEERRAPFTKGRRI